MLKLPISVLVLCMFISVGKSQSIEADVVEWTVNHLTDLNAQIDTAYQCKFVTYPNEKVDWVQGDYVISLTVEETHGNWTDINVSGTYQYDVLLKDKSGKIIFTRSNHGLTVRMEFLEGTTNRLPFEFSINETRKIEP